MGRLHATFHAGAAAVSNRGVLIPGPRRCGKSVLTLGLLLKGGRYLSEDVALLEHRSLQLKPSGRGVSLRRDALALFPELAGRWTAIPADDGDPLRQVAFACPTRVGSRWANPCAVRLIAFPVYDPHGPRAELEPLSEGRAVLRLLEHCITLGTTVDRGLDILIGLTDRADAYLLRYHDARAATDLVFDRARSCAEDGLETTATCAIAGTRIRMEAS
ncbi:MAG TPA: hypothetical protein VNI78_04695 [Vicinamibacterales bacterium]|nr:hypothetical protein [Vicinamibacterales bacterium]